MEDLTGKTAVITGSGRGSAIAIELEGGSMNPSDKLRKRLISSHQAVLDLVESIDGPTALALRANEGWSGQDMLAHLAASELGHCEVIRLLLSDEPTLIPDFDLDTFNNAEVAKRSQMSWKEILAEYRANRMATLALLDTVPDSAWGKSGPHPGGFDTSVEGVFRVIAIHEKRHLKDLGGALK